MINMNVLCKQQFLQNFNEYIKTATAQHTRIRSRIVSIERKNVERKRGTVDCDIKRKINAQNGSHVRASFYVFPLFSLTTNKVRHEDYSEFFAGYVLARNNYSCN